MIDCVGMDGKNPIEWVEQKLKLQGGTIGPIQIATKAVRKGGTLQITGVYGGLYNMFPLGPFFYTKHYYKNGPSTGTSLYAILVR